MQKLVFLHCSGGDSKDYPELLSHIAKSINAETISFNAPLSKTKDKYFWFKKDESHPRRDAIEQSFTHAVNFIEEKLLELKIPLSDIILLGHSQGGAMASVLASQLNLKLAISIVGDLPYNIAYTNKSITPILWLESKKDTYLSDARKESYKILQKINAKIDYHILENSSHFEFDSDKENIAKLIKNKLQNNA